MKKAVIFILTVINLLIVQGLGNQIYAQESGLSGYQSPVWSPDGKNIVFSADKDKNTDIYIINREGLGLKRLTDNSARDSYPAWSPDGKKIAFASYRSDGKTTQIYVMNKDGSNVVQLTEKEKNSFPAWSPDGKKIVFMSKRGEAKWQIYLMNADGSNQKRLTNNSANDYNPVFSPNGKKILFESDRDGGDVDEIYVMNTDGSQQKRLTDNNADEENDIFPIWLSKGKEISFSKVKNRKVNVYKMNADGTQQTLLIKEASFANWSPDGKKLVYVSMGNAENPPQIFLADADGSNSKQLTK